MEKDSAIKLSVKQMHNNAWSVNKTLSFPHMGDQLDSPIRWRDTASLHRWIVFAKDSRNSQNSGSFAEEALCFGIVFMKTLFKIYIP